MRSRNGILVFCDLDSGITIYRDIDKIILIWLWSIQIDIDKLQSRHLDIDILGSRQLHIGILIKTKEYQSNCDSDSLILWFRQPKIDIFWSRRFILIYCDIHCVSQWRILKYFLVTSTQKHCLK